MLGRSLSRALYSPNSDRPATPFSFSDCQGIVDFVFFAHEACACAHGIGALHVRVVLVLDHCTGGVAVIAGGSLGYRDVVGRYVSGMSSPSVVVGRGTGGAVASGLVEATCTGSSAASSFNAALSFSVASMGSFDCQVK